MFVLSYVVPPVGGAAFGKSTVLEPVHTMDAVHRRIMYILINDQDIYVRQAADFATTVTHELTGTERVHTGTGTTFRIDPEDRAPNACPCCGRLVLPGDHAFAGSEDAYCLGCYTWDDTPACLPENSCHTWGEVRYEVDGETVVGGKPGERWHAVYRVPNNYADDDIREEVAETYGAPHFERITGECANGSPTCTPDDPCVICYDKENGS